MFHPALVIHDEKPIAKTFVVLKPDINSYLISKHTTYMFENLNSISEKWSTRVPNPGRAGFSDPDP